MRLKTKPDTTGQTPKAGSAPPQAAVQPAEPVALVSEQQVMFASAAALTSAPARHPNVVHGLASAVRGMFTRPEKPHVRKHYPQRFAYLESSALSREMGRL